MPFGLTCPLTAQYNMTTSTSTANSNLLWPRRLGPEDSVNTAIIAATSISNCAVHASKNAISYTKKVFTEVPLKEVLH